MAAYYKFTPQTWDITSAFILTFLAALAPKADVLWMERKTLL